MTNNNHVPELPAIFSTVVHMLADANSRSAEREALICGTQTLTYAEYTRCVAALAHRLIQLGARGGRVAILLANSNEPPLPYSLRMRQGRKPCRLIRPIRQAN